MPAKELQAKGLKVLRKTDLFTLSIQVQPHLTVQAHLKMQRAKAV